MKLLIFSDLHNEELALSSLTKLSNSKRFNYLINCGDITTNNISFAEELQAIDAFTIAGNNESDEVKEIMKKGNYIHEKRIEINDQLNIVGFGFSNITPYGTLNELTEEEIYKKISKLKVDNNSVLVCHCPPFGYFDQVREKSIGSTAILKIIQEKQPFLVLCGHVHELSGVKKIGASYIVKVPAAVNGKACIVNINKRQIEVEFIAL
ncbi:MAG: metallophosphoesterase family protein [Candidatus Micrarchaeota archaeon]|nr:metallophosphoesterase family protein [Candidatus Micrarchaeota archaeon]